MPKSYSHSFKITGFTLIELLVVIAIIGMLASIVLASLSNARAKSRDARRISDLRQVQLAVELFYDQVGEYPQAPGHATWSGHWAYFSQCLERGDNCNAPAGYTPVISKVPQDPSRSSSDPFANDKTYYPSYHPSGRCPQSYRILAVLETDHSALQSDIDGSIYSTGDGLCNDNARGYCIGAGTCVFYE